MHLMKSCGNNRVSVTFPLPLLFLLSLFLSSLIIKPCLYAAPAYDLKTLLRNGASDQELRELLTTIVGQKGHYTKANSRVGTFEKFSMQSIGG